MRENDKVPSFHQGQERPLRSHMEPKIQRRKGRYIPRRETVQANSLKWRTLKRPGELGPHEEIVQMRLSKGAMPRL